MSGIPSLSAASLDWIALVMSNTWAASTKSCYKSGLCQFYKFCNMEGVKAHLHLPASEVLLCAFAASTLGHHGALMAKAVLSAVRAWHIEEGVP